MEKRFALDEMACFEAYRLHHAFGRFYQAAFAGTGYTYPKYLVIKALQEHGKMSLTELAARLGVEPNTLSPLVKKMAAFEVVERLRDPEDERRIVIQLTPRGMTALQDADAIVADHFGALDITEEEASQTIQLISRLRVALDRVADKCDAK